MARIGVAVLLFLAVGCGSTADTGDEVADSSSTTAPEPTSTTAPSTSATTSSSGAGQLDGDFSSADQLEWVLELLARPEPPLVTELDARFTADFLAAIPSEQLLAVLADLAGTYDVVADDEGEVQRSGVLEGPEGIRFTFDLVIDPADGGRISGLLFQPAAPEFDGPLTTDAIDQAMTDFAPHAEYGLFAVTDGTCEAIHRLEADAPSAVGSVFKLWVLAAVAEAASAGDLSWDDEVEVTAELRSTPDGEVQQLADGDTITVAELAVLMISISDNTATDLLIDHVGRLPVEEAMVRAGVAEPERNIPFPTTREIFLLKLDPTHAGYLDLDADARRAYLDETLAGLPLGGPDGLDPASLPPGPWQIESLEWFATSGDLCNTMARLAELAEDPVNQTQLERALSTNPGQDVDPARWPTVWFKGGSEPGVVATTWYLVDADGQAFVVTGALNDPDRDFGEVAGVSVILPLIPLLESLDG